MLVKLVIKLTSFAKMDDETNQLDLYGSMAVYTFGINMGSDRIISQSGHDTFTQQCWGKLLLKVMHYNIALLPKKVTNYVTWLLFMEGNALRYFHVTFELLFKHEQGLIVVFNIIRSIYSTYKSPFTPKKCNE